MPGEGGEGVMGGDWQVKVTLPLIEEGGICLHQLCSLWSLSLAKHLDLYRATPNYSTCSGAREPGLTVTTNTKNVNVRPALASSDHPNKQLSDQQIWVLSSDKVFDWIVCVLLSIKPNKLEFESSRYWFGQQVHSPNTDDLVGFTRHF